MRSSLINSQVSSPLARIVTGHVVSMGVSLFLFAGVVQATPPADSVADTLVVQPTQLIVSATKPVTDILLHNTAAEARTIHVNVNAWQQVGGRDQLRPSGKLIVHPETIKLQPGKTARVRVALKMSGPLWEEQAFQLQLTEVPRAPDVGSAVNYSANSQLVRRSNVQVFLQPPGTVNPRISWQVARNPEGVVILKASNSGKAHVQLHSASLAGPDGQRIEMRNLSAVILPGGSRSWSLMENALGGLWQLTADTNAGPMKAELELEPNQASSRSLVLAQ